MMKVLCLCDWQERRRLQGVRDDAPAAGLRGGVWHGDGCRHPGHHPLELRLHLPRLQLPHWETLAQRRYAEKRLIVNDPPHRETLAQRRYAEKRSIFNDPPHGEIRTQRRYAEKRLIFNDPPHQETLVQRRYAKTYLILNELPHRETRAQRKYAEKRLIFDARFPGSCLGPFKSLGNWSFQ